MFINADEEVHGKKARTESYTLTFILIIFSFIEGGGAY